MPRSVSASLLFFAAILAWIGPAFAQDDADTGAGDAGAAQAAFPPVHSAPQSSGSAALPPPPAPPPGSSSPPLAKPPPRAAPPPIAAATPGPAPAPPPPLWPGSGTAWRPGPPPAAGSATPDTLPPPEEDKPRYKTRWYGWQTLIVDGASIGLMFGGASAQSDTAMLAGVFGFALGPPIVHFSHGNVGRGFISMGLRVGMPVVLAYGFAAGASCGSSDSYCGLGEAALGFLVGMAGASAIDAAAIAREKVPVEPSVAVVPMLGRDHAGLAISGAF